MTRGKRSKGQKGPADVIGNAIRMSPAKAAGIADRLWSMEDIVTLIDAREDASKKSHIRKLSAGHLSAGMLQRSRI